ncbi:MULTISPECIES: DUF6894 family protein [Sphingomonas]|jgi:hypothetical protein|uniref:DUF6894 family protein n=1 Tax=Sphingomonas TaxID=13687 RepID=UPI0004DB51DC|nr:hypothetical protein [Sphingomonas sp. STIS6.2]
MARYFFNAADNRHGPDSEGTELADHAAARKHAIIFAGQIMHGEPAVLWDGRDFVVDVTNERGLMLFRLTAYVTNAPAGGDTK